MSLTLQDLQDITAICQAGSFRRAANQLGITQPTLSSRVALMEQRLGARLFERARGRSRPTQLALTIADQSVGLLGQVSGLVNEVQRVAEGERGLVRMGFGPVPDYVLLEDVIQAVDASFPGATVLVQSGAADQLTDMLAEREVDLAVCAGGREFMLPELKYEPLIRDAIVAIVRHDHPLAGLRETCLAEVFRHPVGIPVLDRHYGPIVREGASVEPTRLADTVYCSNFWVLESLVDSGRYATLCPSFCFAQAVAEGRFVALPLQERLVHEIWLYTNLRSLPLPAVERVIDIIRTIAARFQGTPLALN